MATTGTSPALPAQLPFTPGQGPYPVAWVLYTTDDASDTDPLWVDATRKVRSFTVSRGRSNEQGEVDAGTATIVLDNRARLFDPVFSTGVRPMNRWRILEQFTGETQSVFIGYAESYDQTWTQPFDAVATVNCTDEFKILALDGLPTTSPPRQSYAELISYDAPDGHWELDDDPESLIAVPADTQSSDEQQTAPPTATGSASTALPTRPLHIGDPWA